MSRVSRGDLGLVLGALALFVSLGGTSVAADVGGRAVALIKGKELASGTISAREIKTGAVGSAEIAGGAVRSAELAARAVVRGKIARDAVGGDEIGTDAVGGDELGTDAVGGDELAPRSVGPGEITDGLSNTIAVTEGEVGSTEITDGSVRTIDLGEGQVGAGQVADGSLGAADFGAGSIGSIALADGSVRFVDMAPDSVGGDQIRPGSVTLSDINDGTSNTLLFGEVQGERIPDDDLTDEQIDEGTLPFIDDGQIRTDGDLRTDEVATPASYGAIASKQVTAAVAGKALITAAFSAKDAPAAGEGRVRYRLTVDGTDVGTGAVQELNLHAVVDDAQSGAATAVVPVTAGAHTFALEAVDVGSGSLLLRRSISVLVLPG